jgi:WD40 repeat protein
MNMNLHTNACHPERLESFLRGEMNDLQEQEFALHLNTCENCRRVLEQQAAEAQSWIEAEKLLKPSEFDAPDADRLPQSGAGQESGRPPLQIQSVLEALGPTDDPAMLGRIGGYEVCGVVGAGGMGVVLKAIDKPLDRTVAVKVLAPHLATIGAARKRFSREAKAAAAVLHPNVIAIHGVSNDGELPYLVMPYVRGTSLQKRLDAEGPLPLKEVLRIGAQIAAGLSAAHAQGLVHRDIKPANILLEEGVERVTITDFGLARAVDDATITHSGMIAGTPQYMSPEQVRGEALEQRSDLFSLGSVLYAICTGRPPFRADTTYGVMRRIADDEPTSIRSINPDIPEWLCAVVERLMSKRPGDRFESAAEVAELLEKCLAHVQQPDAAPLPAFLVPKTAGRRWLSRSRRKGVIAMLGTVGVIVLGAVLWQAAEAPDIAGTWSGDEWGRVVLKKASAGEYTGTYSDTAGNEPGEIQLKWSRRERRFNGTWREGDERFGKLSVRLLGDEIRGANTTDSPSDLNPAAPRLGDLSWTRVPAAGSREAAAKPVFGPTRERVLPYGVPCMQQHFQFRSGMVFVIGNGPATTDEEFEEDRKRVEEAGGADMSLGSNAGIQLVGEGCIFTQDFQDLHWDTFTAEQVVKAMKRVNFSYGVVEPAVKELPATYLFKTARGEVGIMEILGIVEDARGFHGSGGQGQGMKFRYKLALGPGDKLPKRQAADAVPVAEKADAKAADVHAPIGAPHRVRQIQTADRVAVIAASPDGRFVAFANDHRSSRQGDDWKPTVEILDAGPGKTIVSWKLTTDEEDALIAETRREPPFIEVDALAFSPDGNVLAVGTRIGQLKLFDVRTGALIQSLDDAAAKRADKKTPEKLKALTRAMGSVASLAFSPDGSLLAACGDAIGQESLAFERIERTTLRGTGPGRLKVWEVKTGTVKHDLVGHSHASAVAFSPDGNLLASAGSWAGREHGTGVIVWNPQTGAKIRTIVNNANGGTRAVAFSPNSKLVAISARIFDKDNDTSTSAISVAHAITGIVEWQRTVPGWAHPVVFTPDGKTVAVLCGGESIRFFATETGAMPHQVRPADNPEGGSWTFFAITPQGLRLVIGGVNNAGKGTVELWDFDRPGGDR